jgi:REP element-mobilizing transposase RayT
MRKHNFVIGEYYHIYNRGTDKRKIILNEYDLDRILKSIKYFNTLEPIGSIYEFSFQEEQLGSPTTKLVSIIAYCINPNHFHLILTPLVEKGIEKFMQRIGGYTRYFNEKHKRNGVLFQGKFKSKHISDNKYLLHLSAYINMNNRDKCGNVIFKLSKSSLEEYTKCEKGNKNNMCDTQIVLEQFKNGKEYLDFALEAWQDTLARKKALDLEPLGSPTTK